MNSSIDQDPNRTLTLILYVLYIVAIFTGGLLAIIALIINYVKRSDVQGSFCESLYLANQNILVVSRLEYYCLFTVIFLFFTGENIDLFAGVAISSTVFCVGVITAAWIWIVYRAIRGLIALNDNRPMYQ